MSRIGSRRPGDAKQPSPLLSEIDRNVYEGPDSTNDLAFLRRFGLENEIRVNVEVNHATLVGHCFQREIAYALEARSAEWTTDLVGDILGGKASLESLHTRALNREDDIRPVSGHQERLENQVRAAIEKNPAI